MSVHWEEVEASESGVDWYLPREGVSEGLAVDAGEYGIGFDSGSGGVLVRGNAADLVRWATSILEHAKKAEAHAAAPLGLIDFAPDEDGDFVCPRCGVTFEVRAHDDLAHLVRGIEQHATGHNDAA